MATELLFVPCGWLEEFEPSDMLRPEKKKRKKSNIQQQVCYQQTTDTTP